jgi:hypothetical protein
MGSISWQQPKSSSILRFCPFFFPLSLDLLNKGEFLQLEKNKITKKINEKQGKARQTQLRIE